MGTDAFTDDGVVVIDLGFARGEPDEYATPTRRTVPDWFAPVLIAVAVLFSSAASAAPPPPPLAPVLSLPIGAADSYALTDPQLLLAQTLGRLSAYDLATGRLRWQVDATTPAYRVRTTDGLVLMRPWAIGRADPATTALSLADGAVRWSHVGSIVPVDGSPVLLAVSAVRSLYGNGRRVEGPIAALDAMTGHTRWQVPVAQTAVLLGLPGPAGSGPRMLLLEDGRVAQVRDLATGQVLASAVLPPADYGPGNPTLVGGTLLLHHPEGDATAVTAYDPATLAPRWTRPAGQAYDIEECGRLACLTGPRGVRAVDPADGTPVWYRHDWRSVEQRGALLLAYGEPTAEGELLGIVDPDTTRLLVDLHGWRAVPGEGGGDHLLVTREEDGGARTMVAVATPGGALPRPLADLPPGTGDCQAVPARLVCRTAAGELMVWAYRKG
jgi:outer membrane protein assembly factor BamB